MCVCVCVCVTANSVITDQENSHLTLGELYCITVDDHNHYHNNNKTSCVLTPLVILSACTCVPFSLHMHLG